MTYDHYPFEARSAHTFESATMRIKNEDPTNNEQACSVTMERVGEHVNRPAEILADMFVTLRGASTEVTDRRGASMQILDTFSNTMCHNFHQNTITSFVSPIFTLI